jgi:hypothetical protein
MPAAAAAEPLLGFRVAPGRINVGTIRAPER